MSSSLQQFLTHPRSPSSRPLYEEQLSPEWESEVNDALAQETLFNLASIEITLSIDCIALWKFNYLQKQQGVLYDTPTFDFLGLSLLCQRKIIADVDQKTFLNCQLVSMHIRQICRSVAKQRIFKVEEVYMRQLPLPCLKVAPKSNTHFPFPSDFHGKMYAKNFCIEASFFTTVTVKSPSFMLTQLSKVSCETLWINNMQIRVNDQERVEFFRKLIKLLNPKFICGGQIGNLLSSEQEFEGITAIITNDEELTTLRAKRIKVFQAQFSFSAVNVILKEWQEGTRYILKMEISWLGGRGGGENEMLSELGAEVRENETWIRKKNEQMARIRIGPTTFTMKQIEVMPK